MKTTTPISVSTIAFLLAAAISVFGADVDSAGSSAAPDSMITGGAKTPSNIRKAFVIPVVGTVDHGMAAFVGRAVGEASKHDILVCLENVLHPSLRA